MININDSELQAKSNDLKSNLAYFDRLGQPIVDEYAKELDEKVSAIKQYLQDIRTYNLDFDIPSLQRMLVDLSTTIYYTNDRLEKLGVLDDMSSIKYKDRYNDAYLTKQGNNEAGKKFSVEQLRNYAEQEAIEERLINFIYSHSAKILKSKLESANELLKVLSKILSSKIQEMSTFGASQRYSN